MDRLMRLKWCYETFTTVEGADSEELHSWMLALVLSQSIPLFVGSLSSVVAGCAVMTLTGQKWPIAWLAVDLTLTAFRLATIRALNSQDISTDRRKHSYMRLMLAGLGWAGCYGAGSSGMILSAQPALMVLAALNVAGAVSTIAMRNAGTPRFGVLAMVACILPFEIGLIRAPSPAMSMIAVLVPLLVLGFCLVLYQNTKILVRTFHAERTLSELASQDPLTGLLNRKSLDERLTNLSRSSSGHPLPALAILCLDLDGFKAINDTFGHAAGDALLKAVAERLNRLTRGHDGVFRLGGDEFVCTLPGAGVNEAQIVAERIVAAITQPIDLGDGRVANVSISIGGATRQSEDDLAQTLLLRADAALYCAKRLGRNRISFAEDCARME